MKIYSVNDPEFKPYGRVVTGLEAAKAEILQALATTQLPERCLSRKAGIVRCCLRSYNVRAGAHHQLLTSNSYFLT